MIRRTLVSVALVATAIAAAPTPAAGGVYDVVACSDAPDAVNNSWTAWNNTPSKLETGNGCGQGAAYGGLFDRDVLAVSNAAAGSEARWSFAAPTGTSITGISYARWFFKDADDDWEPALKADGTTHETCTIVYPAVSCAVGAQGGTRTSRVVANASFLTVGVRCAATAPTTCGNGGTFHAAVAVLYGATVTLSDPSAPSVTNVAGSLFAGGYLTGTRGASFDATDNSGIRSARLYVDGDAKPATTYACDFTYTVPCSSRPGGALSIDTRTLADGPHTVQVAASDAAMNETKATPQEIVVDNTAPTAPESLAVDGGSQPRTTNSFAVSWSNPAAQVAPIAAAHHQLCASDGSSCGAPVRTAGTGISRVDGISAPAQGEWRLSVWLEDAAGNVDSSSARSVTLRYGVATTTQDSSGSTTGTTPTATTAPASETSPSLTSPLTPVSISPIVPRASARLAVRSVTRRGRTVTVRGRAAATATGSLRVTIRSGRRVIVAHRRLRGGTFRLTFRTARGGRITLRYAGSTRFLPTRVTRSFR